MQFAFFLLVILFDRGSPFFQKSNNPPWQDFLYSLWPSTICENGYGAPFYLNQHDECRSYWVCQYPKNRKIGSGGKTVELRRCPDKQYAVNIEAIHPPKCFRSRGASKCGYFPLVSEAKNFSSFTKECAKYEEVRRTFSPFLGGKPSVMTTDLMYINDTCRDYYVCEHNKPVHKKCDKPDICIENRFLLCIDLKHPRFMPSIPANVKSTQL